MWDLSTIQTINIAASVLVRKKGKVIDSRCGMERRSIGEDLIRLYKSHHMSPEDALDHYSKND